MDVICYHHTMDVLFLWPYHRHPMFLTDTCSLTTDIRFFYHTILYKKIRPYHRHSILLLFPPYHQCSFLCFTIDTIPYSIHRCSIFLLPPYHRYSILHVTHILVPPTFHFHFTTIPPTFHLTCHHRATDIPFYILPWTSCFTADTRFPFVMVSGVII